MKELTKDELDRLWPRVRVKLYSLANGATTNFDPKTRHVKPDSNKPPNRHSDIAGLEEAWSSAYSRRNKERVLWDGLIFLWLDSPPAYRKAALPYMPQSVRDQLRKLSIKQMRNTQEWEIAVAFYRHPITGEFPPLRTVAKTFGVSHESVRKWRLRYAGIESE